MGKFMVIKTSPIEMEDDANEVLINLEMITSIKPAANGAMVSFSNGTCMLDVSHGYNDYKKILADM